MDILGIRAFMRQRRWGGRAGPQAPGIGWRLWAIVPAGLLLAVLIQRFFVSFVLVHGESMTPSFSTGQLCLVRAWPTDLARGDVVVVHDGRGASLKRVVGLPNESLLFQNGKVYVNGRELTEPYLCQATRTYPVYQTRFTLDHEQVFVMGDNRGQSEDSRVYGPLESKAVAGRVTP